MPLLGSRVRIWQRGAGSCTQHLKGSREVAIRVISTVKLRTEIRERPPQTKISGGSAPQTPPARSLRSLAPFFFSFFFKLPFFTFTFFRSTTLEKSPSFRVPFVFPFCFPFVKIKKKLALRIFKNKIHLPYASMRDPNFWNHIWKNFKSSNTQNL